MDCLGRFLKDVYKRQLVMRRSRVRFPLLAVIEKSVKSRLSEILQAKKENRPKGRFLCFDYYLTTVYFKNSVL